MFVFLSKKYITVLLLSIFFNSFGQSEIITGTVTDKTGTPVPGVNILEDSDSYNGAVTDFDGNFIIKSSPKATLIISYVGFITQEIRLSGQTNLNIVLEEDLFGLEEVTVVAYGEQKKESVIAAVTSFKFCCAKRAPAISSVIFACIDQPRTFLSNHPFVFSEAVSKFESLFKT